MQASFAFIGSRTYEKTSKRLEDYKNTQRFRVYKQLVWKKIGNATFMHVEYEIISGYMLVNRHSADNLQEKERSLAAMFAETYQNIPDPG